MLKKKIKKLGEILLDHNVITPEQLQQALVEQKINHSELGQILLKHNYITEADLAIALSEQLEIPYLELDDYEIDEEATRLIPNEIAHHHVVIPVFLIDKVLTVALANPQDVTATDTLRRISKKQIEPVLATEKDILASIEQYYGTSVKISNSMDEVIQTLEAESEESKEEKAPEEALRQLAEDQPVVKLVNMILAQAIRDRASDIHINPEEDLLRVRFRIDGILHEIFTPPKNLQAAVISRLKILAEIDIAENRIPQDGRFRILLDNREIDLRVSTLPTAYGENVVLRLLDKSSVLLDMKDLGFSSDNLAKIKDMLSNSYGIILVTGPTGSGKTTTLYTGLNYLNTIEKNIITVEDPIEYRLKMIRQSQVNTKSGMTFASGLRSILRQDPDIIMVGEIRDGETANIALQAALTGHLVLSTLHTNDAVGALSRMQEMGIEPFLLATAAVGVIAQRLVREICAKCKEECKISQHLMNRFGLNRDKDYVFYHGKGCNSCKGTGYRCRLGIYEILKMDDKIKEMVIANCSAEKIKSFALKNGMKTLKHDGILKALKGYTTIEEVLRVTNID